MSYSSTARLGDYANSGDWTWEHWPPPFTQWGPSNPAKQPSAFLGGGSLAGLGCSSCGGGCNSVDQGLGQTGLFGTGLFAGGLNPSTWGIGEWATVGIAGYLGVQVIGSHPAIKKVGRKARRGASQGSSAIGNIVLLGGAAYAAYYFWNQYQTTGQL